MRTYIYIIMCALLPLMANAQNWEQANKAYNDGRYDDAIAEYEAILQEGPSAEVYYNMGNAYFKKNELAQAILAYERSLRLDASNKDAQFNLKYAEGKITDNIENKDQFFLRQVAQSIRNKTTESNWLGMAVVLFVLTLVGMLLFAFMAEVGIRKTAFFTSILTFILSVVALWCGLSLHYRDAAREEAIILRNETHAKSAPDQIGKDVFVVNEGTKVRINKTEDDWCEIHVGNNVGWIPTTSLERI